MKISKHREWAVHRERNTNGPLIPLSEKISNFIPKNVKLKLVKCQFTKLVKIQKFLLMKLWGITYFKKFF